ncbi:hypothetical protein BCF74_1519 [Knoellia remsis]|uniref:Uncharacterized protein n=1 Tax=Knoellia remsis TaxID=407159 RepID=A0A2T0TRL9_9MICO|nr:hypothetical protein [Knoellia remsis]PRY48362.1 hypothetical protein BCF74_1519 [Knoellia remsis]
MSASTPEERLRIALDLADAGVEMQRMRLRRENPGITDEQLDEAMATWFRHRPGAEFGDYPGPRSTRRLGSSTR